jgi:HD-GYP domain-containing protein (c-di-GMP phosphodiesterase class II)
MPGGGAELLHKKFPEQVRGEGIDNDAGILQMWKAVNEFLLNASENRKADPSAVMSTADTIINSLRKNNDLVKTLFAKKQSNDITSHLIDTAIVAAKIGFALGYGSGQMRDLVICALVHDIGMLRVQEDVRLKKNGLSETEWIEIRKHPAYSYEMLKDKGLPPIVSEVAYQEQEREDGSGYPRGLKGESIHEYAKIIGLSAIYTAMLQPRPQRERKIPFEIIKEIIEQHKEQFPRHLIRIVIEEFSVFPVGLYVKLNTGEIARVVLTNRLTPMKPTIEALIDSHGRRLQEPKKYDMTKEPILQIVDTSFEIA